MVGNSPCRRERLLALLLAIAITWIALPAAPAAAAPPPIPGIDAFDAHGTPPRPLKYWYWNADYLRDLGYTEPSVNNLSYAKGKLPGSVDHMLERWHDYLNDPKRKTNLPFKSWLEGYITSFNSLRQGTSFDNDFGAVEGLIGKKDWKRQVQVAKQAGMTKGTRFDYYYDDGADRLVLEIKSGAEPDWEQFPNLVIAAALKGAEMAILFGERPTQATKDRMDRIIRETNATNTKTGKVQTVSYRYYPTDKQPVSPGPNGVKRGTYGPSPAATATPGNATPDSGAPAATNGPAPTNRPGGGAATAPGAAVLATNGQTGQGALATAVGGSPATADQAQEMLRVLAAENEGHAAELGVDPPSATARDLGGVDFSTLQLRYLSDNGNGVQYAFRANELASDKLSFGGQQAARLASDSFFVFLALPAAAQTVNLNPTEPNRIIDAKFGTTDAGRVLLEADLQMKKSIATYINPETPDGLRFWQALRGDTRCLAMRQWIVPGVASVRDAGDEVYILDAPLEVKMEKDYSKASDTVTTPGCRGQSATGAAHNEQIYRDMILPKIQKDVNEGAAYADLRRVYASRVAAEWYKQRSGNVRTTYGNLVGRNDVSQWPSQTSWDPKEVFNRYVESYTKGEFNVTREERQGNKIITHTYIYGGVDWRKAPLIKVGAAAFDKAHGGLPGTIRDSVKTAQTAEGGLWLGGGTRATGPSTIPPGPTSNVLFYITIALPALIWAALGSWLARRRPGQPKAA
jgi:hypothetical protein